MKFGVILGEFTWGMWFVAGVGVMQLGKFVYLFLSIFCI